MTISDPVARRASALLLAIAAGNREAASEYDSLLFPMLRATAMRRGRYLGLRAAQQLGASAPVVRPADLEEAGVYAAELALDRARASAQRFDPAKGDGASWALGALGTAYLDAIRQLTGSRRTMVELPIENMDLVEQHHVATLDPAVIAEARDSLRRALAELTDDERYVVVAALQYGMSHREIATYLFHDPEEHRKVERTLARARAKLRVLHQQWLLEP